MHVTRRLFNNFQSFLFSARDFFSSFVHQRRMVKPTYIIKKKGLLRQFSSEKLLQIDKNTFQ